MKIKMKEAVVTLSTEAEYRNGVLRPMSNLPLADGERVEILLIRSKAGELTSPAQLEQRRLLVARLHELDAEADLEPDDGYDLVEELNKHRRGMGARLINTPDPARPIA